MGARGLPGVASDEEAGLRRREGEAMVERGEAEDGSIRPEVRRWQQTQRPTLLLLLHGGWLGSLLHQVEGERDVRESIS